MRGVQPKFEQRKVWLPKPETLRRSESDFLTAVQELQAELAIFILAGGAEALPHDDMIDTMRAQVEDMQRKCRRYDFKMARSAISIEEAANVLKVPVSKIKKVLEDEYIIQERCTYVENNKPILKVTERGKSFDMVFIQNEIGKNGVEEVIMINEDGMAYLNGRV